MPNAVSGFLFALVLSAVVWYSTGLVGRLNAILIGGMVVTFLMSAGGLIVQVQMPVLLENKPGYALFLLAAVPYYLTSFGFHGNVPSLMKYYGKDPARIRQCLLYGSLLSLAVYSLWHLLTMGNLSRDQFRPIIDAGGNIGDLIGALIEVSNSDRLAALLRREWARGPRARHRTARGRRARTVQRGSRTRP